MKILQRFALLTSVIVTLISASFPADAVEPPVAIIFDTDVDHDCDDIGALYILHGAVERGEVKLLATIGCTSSDAIAPCLDGMNTWFGRPDIPVGTLKDTGFLDHKGFAAELNRHYPSKFASGKDYPDAVKLYRQTLAKQPDGSVVVLAVGPLRNLANLLKSQPDNVSPLDGKALIAAKVKRLDIMGGIYPPVKNAKDAEWNFKQDPESAALVCSTWPTPVLFNGEGGSTNSGRRVTYEMPEHNPLTMAYRLYPGVGYAGDRLSWDSISALVAIRGGSPWYEVVGPGTNVTDPATGMNTWLADKDSGHSYLVLKSRKHEIEKALEDMQTVGTGRPTKLKFDTVYYADAGMCQITHTGKRNKEGIWQDKSPSGWIQYQHVDGRKRLVTSYAVLCKNRHLLPPTLELSGSNDGGATWTQLDLQGSPGFSEETPRREFTIAQPAKWNMYRLAVTVADEKEGVRIDSIELLESINCTPGVEVASITLDHTTLKLPANGRATLNATTAPRETFDREIEWMTSDPGIAEIRRIGEQTAMVVGKKPGACTVTATIGNRKQICAITVTDSTLPEGWSYDELNAPPVPGAAVVADGKFSLTGSGHAMTSWWERVLDQGVFASKAVTGNMELTACLTNLGPSVGGPSYKWDNRPPTASGLMIRETLTQPRGRYLLVQVEATGELVCRWRDKTNDQDDNKSHKLGKVELPIHLRLVRDDKEIRVFTSSDGKSWGEPRMSHRAAFGDEDRIGLFVSSGNTFASSTATFEEVSVTSR